MARQRRALGELGSDAEPEDPDALHAVYVYHAARRVERRVADVGLLCHACSAAPLPEAVPAPRVFAVVSHAAALRSPDVSGIVGRDEAGARVVRLLADAGLGAFLGAGRVGRYSLREQGQQQQQQAEEGEEEANVPVANVELVVIYVERTVLSVALREIAREIAQAGAVVVVVEFPCGTVRSIMAASTAWLARRPEALNPA